MQSLITQKMHKLDNIKTINKLDKQGMHQSIEALGKQCQQAWDEVKDITVPASYTKVKNIVVSGMGGSALGAHIISVLFKNELQVPLQVINSYSVPAYVNRDTLYVISSYSGTTEEPIGTFGEVKRRKAKLLLLGTGGQVARWVKQQKLPGYIFEPRYNPCDQPRMGLGYSVVGQIALLKKAGLLTVSEKDFQAAIRTVTGLQNRFGIAKKQAHNPAKQAACRLQGRIPIIVAAEHLSGNAHVMANQINENSKTFSAYFLIPELNHHLMEGMRYPATNKRQLQFVFIESKQYYGKVLRRFSITQKVLRKNSITYQTYRTASRRPFSEMMEVLLFGSYVNYYLSLLNNLDPSPIPFVDFFKKELAKK